MRKVIFPSPVDVWFEETIRKPLRLAAFFILACRADLRSVNPPYGLSRSRCWGITARTQHLSIVIAGLDPAIHAENLLARSLRAASYAECHHGPPGQARW